MIGEQDSRIDEEARDEMRRLRREGLNYREIAARLEVPKSSVYRILNPAAHKRHLEQQKRLTVAARRALRQKEREADVRTRGGNVAEAYSLIRKALQELERAVELESDRDAKRHMQSGMARLHSAEDEIVKAVRLHG